MALISFGVNRHRRKWNVGLTSRVDEAIIFDALTSADLRFGFAGSTRSDLIPLLHA